LIAGVAITARGIGAISSPQANYQRDYQHGDHNERYRLCPHATPLNDLNTNRSP